MATMLRHNKIAAFLGRSETDGSGTQLVYERYSMTIAHAIATCRKPSKEARIQLAFDLVEAATQLMSATSSRDAVSVRSLQCDTLPRTPECGTPNLTTYGYRTLQ